MRKAGIIAKRDEGVESPTEGKFSPSLAKGFEPNFWDAEIMLLLSEIRTHAQGL
jgi:hypothetical protein